MPTVKIPLPLTWRRLMLSMCEEVWEGIHMDSDPLYIAVEDGELVVSTEPLADDPSVAPLTEGAYTP